MSGHDTKFVQRRNGQKTIARPRLEPSIGVFTEKLDTEGRGVMPMSASGQKAKYSLRAIVVRCSPNNRHEATAAACPFGASKRLMHRSNYAPSLDHGVGDIAGARAGIDFR